MPGQMCVSGTCIVPPTPCMTDAQCASGQTCLGGMCTGPVDGFDSGAGCPSGELAVEPTTPTIIFIIDRSGSMDDEFGDDTRWTVLRDSLLRTPDGLINALQASVRFGLAMYTSEEAACPDLVTVNAALNNYAGISGVYNMYDPGNDTPTGDSIDAVLAQLPTLVPPEAAGQPVVFVLATDGEPDTCEDGDDEVNGRLESLAAVGRAFAMGIRTFVISVGDDVGDDHLQAVANQGLGVAPGGPNAQFWVATDTAGLNAALSAIVRGEVSCTLSLDGTIDPAQACMGTVTVDSMPLTCNDPNGWRVVDAEHIELLGTACDRATMGADVRATFPCGVIII